MKRFSLPFLLVAALLIFISISFGLLTETQPTGPDSLGYVFAGQQLASRQDMSFVDPHNVDSGPYFYIHMYRMVKPDSVEATFCCLPGVPILFALGALVANSIQGIYYVVPVTAVLLLIATFWIGKLIAHNEWVGLWSAVILTSTVAFWEFSTTPLTDLPSTLFLAGGTGLFIFIMHQRETDKWGLTVIAGFLIGYSLFIRYTNILLAGPGLALYALYIEKKNIWRDKRQWLFWGIIAIFAGLVLVYNWLNLGGPFNTVYSTPELGAYPWPMFSPDYIFGPSPVSGYSAKAILGTLWQNFFVLLLIAPIGWLLFDKSSRLLLIGMILPTIVLYSNYAFAASGINARFLLPIFPFLAIMIAQAVVKMGSRLPNRGFQWSLAILVTLFIYAKIPAEVTALKQRNISNGNLIKYTHDITSDLPRDAVFMSIRHNDLLAVYENRSVLNYRRILRTNPAIGQFDGEMFRACLVDTVDNLLKQKVPVYFIYEDGWGMPELLQSQFILTNINPEKALFEIAFPDDMGVRDVLHECEY